MIDAQLELLEAKRGEVEGLRERGGQADEALANDLAGIRLVLSAALLAGGLGGAEREELGRKEREARELFADAMSPGGYLEASVRRL